LSKLKPRLDMLPRAMRPDACVSPSTSSVQLCEVVPMPTLPVGSTLRNGVCGYSEPSVGTDDASRQPLVAASRIDVGHETIGAAGFGFAGAG
jgi:hypothetical protein